jgi:c-di-GMP-binding flagellar brake protein YcgR
MNYQNLPTIVIRNKKKSNLLLKEGSFLIERRKSPRISVELPFDYSLFEEKEANRGMIVDASEGGLLIYLLEKIEIGALLRIEILFSNGKELTTINAIAKIVWSDLAAKETWAEYQYGLQFLSFLKGDLAKLKILLKEAGKNQR